jgi:hypothetical protein
MRAINCKIEIASALPRNDRPVWLSSGFPLMSF